MADYKDTDLPIVMTRMVNIIGTKDRFLEPVFGCQLLRRPLSVMRPFDCGVEDTECPTG